MFHAFPIGWLAAPFPAAEPSIPQLPEGSPWWAYLVIPALGAVGTVATVIVTRRAGGSSPTGRHATTTAPSPPVDETRPIPRSTDQQLEFAKELVLELRNDRDALVAELAQVKAHAQQLEMRVAQQDRTIAQLQAIVDRLSNRHS